MKNLEKKISKKELRRQLKNLNAQYLQLLQNYNRAKDEIKIHKEESVLIEVCQVEQNKFIELKSELAESRNERIWLANELIQTLQERNGLRSRVIEFENEQNIKNKRNENTTQEQQVCNSVSAVSESQ